MTRLHSQQGDSVSLSRLCRNGSRAAVTGLARVLLGRRPELPWISYDAQPVLARHLAPRSQVLEFGSGMSTLWYARHAGSVFSLEDDPAWFGQVAKSLPANAEVRLATTLRDYLTFPERAYDLVMVDGVPDWRPDCVEAALPFLAPGGIFYLDNSDWPHAAESVRMIMAYARTHGCETRRFVDFAPTQMFVQEGLLMRRPAPNEAPRG